MYEEPTRQVRYFSTTDSILYKLYLPKDNTVGLVITHNNLSGLSIILFGPILDIR